MPASRPRRLPLGWMGAERGWVGFWKEPAEELTVFEFSGELLSSRLKWQEILLKFLKRTL